MRLSKKLSSAVFLTCAWIHSTCAQVSPTGINAIGAPAPPLTAQTVQEGEVVVLRNAAPPLRQDGPMPRWIQLRGPEVEFSQADAFQTSFVAPYVDEPTILEFRYVDPSACGEACAESVFINIENRDVETERLNTDGLSAVDPEVHPTSNNLVLQSHGQLFELPIDERSGRLVEQTSDGNPIAPIASLRDSRNGPEYGLDTMGPSIYFNGVAANGSIQLFRSRESTTNSHSVEQLTFGRTNRVNQLPSQDGEALTTYLVYASFADSRRPDSGWISYINVDEPGREYRVTPVRPGYAGFRWIRGTTQFLTTVAEGPDEGQVLLVDAESGLQRVLTNDDGIKFDPYGWYPPEYGGNLAFHATTDRTDLTIYRDTGGKFFEAVTTLEPPEDTQLRYVQSAEPFVSESGRSLISLTLKDDPGSVYTDVEDSQIWIYGIDGGPDRLTLRCDSGTENTVRHEAEMLSGSEQILVYYNLLQPSGRIDLNLCRTGMRP